MRLDGIHHVTCITGDAPANVDFYTGVLGLRLVKKTVNQDDPTVYHLFYADEKGSPGADITFFEYPGAAPGRAGAGMVHTVVWRVGSEEALDFWAERLGVARDGKTRHVQRSGRAAAPARGRERARRAARSPTIRRFRASSRCRASRACARTRATREQRAAPFFEELGFEPAANRWETRGDSRGGWIEYEAAPDESGIPGAGTVHHVAWASTMEDEERWRERVAAAGGRPTDVIDRFWFRSIYFREPNGVLFEIATLGPGLRDRRGSGASRRDAHPAARVRASARAGRADADAAAEPARELDART